MQQIRFWLANSLLALAGACGPAHAETPPADTAPASLGEVVVTAQKRAQSIEDVPISMTVVDRKALDNTRAATLADMQQLVPNFSVEPQLGTVNVITVRGVGGGGRNIGFDTRVGVYVDGIYMGQAQALDQSLFDIEQVEVLRGPQGHLFGRNTVAGAVNITTRAPSETFESSFRAAAGNYNTREGYANVSGPLTDKLLGKFSVGYEARDGFTTNLFNNQKLDALKRASMRGQLAIHATDRLMIDLAADYAGIKQNRVLGEAVTGMFDAPLPGGLYPNHTVNYNTAPNTDNTLSGASLTMNYDMVGGNTLTAITGYRHTRQHLQNDTDWSQNDVFRVNFTDDFKQFSQEIRIASPIKGPLRYVAGVYLMHESADTYRVAITGPATATLVTHPLAGTLPFGALFGLNPGDTIPVSGTVKTDSSALFGSLDYDLTDKLTLNLGARYTYEKKSLLYNINGAASGVIGMGTAVNYTDGRSDSMLTPTLGATYALGKSLNVYGKYSTGFKSGGWNLDWLTTNQIASKFDFNKETVDSYELGLKGSAPDHRMSYDLALFHSRYKDFQVFQFANLGGGTTEIQLKNAAKAETTGAEASLRALVTDRLTIGGNVGVMRARFNSFPGGLTGGGDAAGKHLPDAPDLTAAVTVNYSMPAPSLGGRVDFYGECSHRNKSYSGVDNHAVTDNLSSRDIVNARVSLVADHPRFGLSLWVRNLFDNNYTTVRGRDFFGNQFVKRGDPRTFGVEGKFSL
ncbi:MAG: TonB-dependent receptor [Gallionella sp.]|nr:TonB-dependent receptor [Gallionella sp.]